MCSNNDVATSSVDNVTGALAQIKGAAPNCHGISSLPHTAV